MTTAGALAIELRKLADALDKEPETVVDDPSLYFNYKYRGDTAKQEFLDIARLLPKPLTKRYSKDEFEVVYNSPALIIKAWVERSKVCVLVEPAKEAVYDCIPLFSAEEEASLEVQP
jgi:hypothetical protein